MPVLEQKALQLAKGRVLDIGAGSGCHTLALQEKGFTVKAIDISPLSCEAMKLRGVKDAECINLYDDLSLGPVLRPGDGEAAALVLAAWL
jgi:methylase of polypeptide subunit release factors